MPLLWKLIEANCGLDMHRAYGLPGKYLDFRYIRLCFGGRPRERLCGNRSYLMDRSRQFFRYVCVQFQSVLR